MNIISAYRQVGSYRGAAELCGTSHKSVKRVVEKAEGGGSTPRECRGHVISTWSLAAARVDKPGGRISAKRLLPIARPAWHGHSAAAAAGAVGCASSLPSAGRIECCGAASTSVGSTRTASCSSSRSTRAGTTSGGRVAGAGRLARTAANWRPVSGFSPAHTSLPSRSRL